MIDKRRMSLYHLRCRQWHGGSRSKSDMAFFKWDPLIMWEHISDMPSEIYSNITILNYVYIGFNNFIFYNFIS